MNAANAAPAEVFDVETARVSARLRDALLGVVQELPGGASRPADVQRAVKVAPAIGWGVFKAATAVDPMEVGLYVPKSEAMRRFLAGAQKVGVSREAIAAAERGLVEFESLVDRHANDREVFEAMVADFTDGDRRGVSDAKARKAAFKANVLLWGRQAETVVVTTIMHPSKDGRVVDQALIAGSVNLCQTRRDVILRLRRFHKVNPLPGISPRSQFEFEPIDDRSVNGQPLGLLHDFCSGDLPEFRTSQEPGQIDYELRARGLGRGSAFTLMMAHLLRGQADLATPVLATTAGINTPSELALVHFLVHTSLCDKTPPRVTVYEHGMESEAIKAGFGVLPQAEHARFVGRGVQASTSADMPRHAEMVRWVTDRLGWDAEAFNVFRLRVEYPIVSSRLRLAFEG